MLHAVIMAGGSGTRFWPESRNLRPKQLLALAGKRTMLQATVDRLAEIAPAENILIATGARLIDAVRQQLPQLPAASILGEPCKRDTAPCIGLAALLVSRNDPDATMLVVPSDHVIRQTADFVQAARLGAQLVDQHPDRIITFGIRPTYPAESFGYIERAEPVAAELPVFRVARFKEKPPAAVAQEYLASGNFYWNSGMFVWKASTILQALCTHQPEMLGHLETIAAALQRPDFQSVFEREFAAIRGVSVDYAVMEHAQDVLVIEAPFDWDDLGSWQSLTRLLGVDTDGNTIAGKHLGVRTSGCIVRNDGQHLIATLGLTDTIIVQTPDATLVANKHDEESIRQLVKLLEERGWKDYL